MLTHFVISVHAQRMRSGLPASLANGPTVHTHIVPTRTHSRHGCTVANAHGDGRIPVLVILTWFQSVEDDLRQLSDRNGSFFWSVDVLGTERHGGWHLGHSGRSGRGAQRTEETEDGREGGRNTKIFALRG